MADISRIVQVTADISSAPGASTASFGSTLLVTPDESALDPSGTDKFAAFDSITAAGQKFASTREPYKAAQAYFAQSPYPKPLIAGRWLNRAQGGRLTGGTPGTVSSIIGTASPGLSYKGTPITFEFRGSLTGGTPGSVATIKAVSNPALSYGGTSVTLDFSADTTFANIADEIQTKLRASSIAGFSAITVTYTNSVFVVTFPPGVTATYFTGSSAASLGLDSASNGTIVAAKNSYSDIASELQAKMRSSVETDLAGVTVTYDSTAGAFIVTFGFTGGAPIVGAAFTGTLSTGLGLTAAASTLTAGYAAETIGAFIQAAEQAGHRFYFVILDDALVDTPDAETISAWAETSSYELIADTHEAGTLTKATGTFVANVFAAQRERTTPIWSARRDYKAASAAARLSSVNFGQPASLITLFGKTLPNTQGDDLTEAQRTALIEQNANFYAQFAGVPVVFDGRTAKNGVFADTRYWLDWFVAETRSSIYGLLRQSNAVPQTNAGVALITEAVNRVCEQGRLNGGLAGGTLPEALAHQVRQAVGSEFDGTVPNGYLVYVQPIARLSDADLAARRIPPIRVWLRGSGAVHNVQVDVTFN